VSVDWKVMTPREVWEALQSAPKVASEWTSPREGKWVRWAASHPDGNKSLDVGDVFLATQFPSPDRRHFFVVDGGCAEPCGSFADGRRAVDERLRGAGWLLVDAGETGITR